MIIRILYVIATVLLLYVLFLVVCSLLVNPKKEYEKDSRFYRFLLNSATICVLKLLRIKVHTVGLEKVPDDVMLLFVGNHRSNYDPIIQWYVLRKWRPSFISKASNFKIPIFGRIIRKCCFMAIDRESPRKAMATINKSARLLKQGEVSIGVYPEGTRSKNGELLPFHNGVFMIAQKANAPIVVMSIRGTERIHKNIPFRRSDIYLDIVDVISADEVKSTKTDVIGTRVRKGLEYKQ